MQVINVFGRDFEVKPYKAAVYGLCGIEYVRKGDLYIIGIGVIDALRDGTLVLSRLEKSFADRNAQIYYYRRKDFKMRFDEALPSIMKYIKEEIVNIESLLN